MLIFLYKNEGMLPRTNIDFSRLTINKCLPVSVAVEPEDPCEAQILQLYLCSIKQQEYT